MNSCVAAIGGAGLCSPFLLCDPLASAAVLLPAGGVAEVVFVHLVARGAVRLNLDLGLNPSPAPPGFLAVADARATAPLPGWLKDQVDAHVVTRRALVANAHLWLTACGPTSLARVVCTALTAESTALVFVQIISAQRVALCAFVSHPPVASALVFILREQLQVGRVHASAVRASVARKAVGVFGVTSVLNFEPVRYRSYPMLVGEAVRGGVSPADSTHPVALGADASGPRPALGRRLATRPQKETVERVRVVAGARRKVSAESLTSGVAATAETPPIRVLGRLAVKARETVAAHITGHYTSFGVPV